jgi:signal transduction histidine kinase
MIYRLAEIPVCVFECFITVFFLNNFIGDKERNKNLFIHSSILFSLLLINNILFIERIGFETVLILINFSLCSLYSYLFLSKNIIRNSICVLLNILIILIINFVMLNIISIVSGVYMMEMRYGSNALRISVDVYSEVIYLIVVMLAVMLKRKYKIKISKNELMIVLLFFISTFIIYNGVLLISPEISPKTTMKFFVLLSGMIFINIAILPLVIHLSKENIKKSELLLIAQHIEKQRNSVNIIQENYEEIRKIKHDMKTYVTGINQLISVGEVSKAIELGNKTISDNLLSNTDFDMLNAVLNAKVKFCKEKNIDFGFLIADKINILGDTEINIIIMNLVDNAIEASVEISDSRIQLIISQEKSYMKILIKNKILSSVLNANPDLETTKKDAVNHGFGIKSIRDIIEKYNGIIDFYEEDNFFHADVFIPIEK